MKRAMILIILVIAVLIGTYYGGLWNRSTDTPVEPEPAEEPVAIEEPVESEPEETITEPAPVEPAPIVERNIYGFMPNLPLDDSSITVYEGVVDPRSVSPKILDEVTITSVVNKFNALPEGYYPDNLVFIEANGYEGMQLQAEAAEQWERWRQAAEAEGYIVKVVGSYRSADTQAMLFENYLAGWGEEALLWSAHPRRSEHEMGLALDLSDTQDVPSEDFIHTPMGAYLAETAHRYGFILRYPQGYEADTGYGFEPWHYRYVGVDLAEAMRQDGSATLEHFYGLTVTP
ncbi:MAG TPA: M15 family metallopeptidase [Tissierellia bacterium]|nr:M15 family metallopeptidase [Tissierellia bacterium]